MSCACPAPADRTRRPGPDRQHHQPAARARVDRHPRAGPAARTGGDGTVGGTESGRPHTVVRARDTRSGRRSGRPGQGLHLADHRARNVPLPQRVASRGPGADGTLRRGNEERGRGDCGHPRGSLRGSALRRRGAAALQRDRPGAAHGRRGRNPDLRHGCVPEHPRLPAEVLPRERRGRRQHRRQRPRWRPRTGFCCGSSTRA